ncbi:carboxypeptidase-like regulatory domain-containing protein [Bremerella sp. T1]|uniref:carboxypeptidase-like regulatory domain-containing protein n=1 Tax=Bremerella sp. TYQ1 TaxID=3119568 RepID=UPI001CCD7338|nr:carboxypeptidase-like regulatory domain-containing protein [Bremerella volcania]UBM35275.1 carboxypeptidase-like regulatory domain-containing protein [Bremerella volcania]
MSSFNLPQLAWLPTTLLCVMLIGCAESGPPLGTVSGTVTMDGKPLPNAIVSFVPTAGGRASVATTNESGEYQLAFIDRMGALIGNHKVSITTAVQSDDEDFSEISSDDPRYEEMLMTRRSDYNNAVVREPIPATYNAKSEIVKEVESGSNVIDFPLNSDGTLP